MSAKTQGESNAVMAACFFFNDTATTEIYTLSLHDALPISQPQHLVALLQRAATVEPSVDHVATKVERRPGAHQRGPQPVRIVDARLDFQLVRRRGRGAGHAKMASSTAAVSERVSNTYAAPVARRAATS